MGTVRINNFFCFQSCPGKCTDQKDCILCQAFNEGEKECDNCTLNIVRVNQTVEQCVVPVENNCFIIFRYEVDEFTKKETFYVQHKKRKFRVLTAS